MLDSLFFLLFSALAMPCKCENRMPKHVKPKKHVQVPEHVNPKKHVQVPEHYTI